MDAILCEFRSIKRQKKAPDNLDRLWEKVLPAVWHSCCCSNTPFSERYGWVQDKYGLSWQLILSNPKGEERPFIVPSLIFVGKVNGKAKEAIDFYLSIFKNSKLGIVARYSKAQEPDKEGTVMYKRFPD